MFDIRSIMLYTLITFKKGEKMEASTTPKFQTTRKDYKLIGGERRYAVSYFTPSGKREFNAIFGVNDLGRFCYNLSRLGFKLEKIVQQEFCADTREWESID